MASQKLRLSQVLRIVLVGFVLAVVVVLPATAQDRALRSSNVGTPATGCSASAPAPGEPEWGIASGISYFVPAAAFVPRNTSSVFVDGSYGRYHLQTAGSGGYPYDLMAPVNLPQGARLTVVRMYWCDTDATNDMDAWLTSYPEADFTGFTDIATASTTGAPGCSSNNYMAVDVTIDNYSNQYNVIARFDAVSGALDLKGARLYYLLQISPAPGVAAFADVPTDYWAFWHIEALYASGITSGCGTGPLIYCPERTITRAEMAVYMAKALGLHWPG